MNFLSPRYFIKNYQFIGNRCNDYHVTSIVYPSNSPYYLQNFHQLNFIRNSLDLLFNLVSSFHLNYFIHWNLISYTYYSNSLNLHYYHHPHNTNPVNHLTIKNYHNFHQSSNYQNYSCYLFMIQKTC